MFSVGKVYPVVLKLFAGAVVIFILSGCAPMPLKDIETPVAGQTTVFGSFEVIKDGKRQKCGKMLGLDDLCNLMILSPGSAQASTYGITEEGSFAWSLAPGDYTIAGFKMLEGRRSGRLAVHFNVPKGVERLYIGNMTLVIEKGLYRAGIKDDYDEAVEKHRAKSPGTFPLPQKALMELESELGTFDSVRYICAEGWGIECTKKYHGVTPIQPKTATQSFNVVDSLTPSFEWKPSSKEGITYDLVIYEAMPYSLAGMVTEYLPGRVVVYEEGLKSPAWQPDAPLKPDHKYYWAVRLRQDRIVSNWSKYSYFAFYIVGWASGHGQWFSFSTPSK